MKSLIIAAALASVAVTGNAFAFSPKDAVVPAPRPIAASVVAPVGLPPAWAGKTVNVEFTLDAAGQPRNIDVLHVNDAVLRRQLVQAFRQWRFEPGVTDPKAAGKHYILPLQLLPEA